MSLTDIKGRSSDLSLRVESPGTATIDARALARLDPFVFTYGVVGLPHELWAGLVILPKPPAGKLPDTFSERARRDDLLAAIDQSGRADVLFIESTMSPPKSGEQGKAWPAIAVFIFLNADKFARVHETLKTAFLAPGSTYGFEIEHIQLTATADAPASMPFRDWRTARQPLIALGQVELAVRNMDGVLAPLVTLARVLVLLATVGVVSLLLQCMR